MKDILNKLFLGVAAPGAGYLASLSTMEVWLRVLSLVVGIAVGIASLVSICFSIRKKYKNWKLEKLINPKDASLYEEETTTT